MNKISRVRIMQVVLSLECGGLEKIAIDLCRGLNMSDIYRSDICCLDKEGELADLARKHNIKVHLMREKNMRSPFFIAEMVQLLRKEKIDIVHTHNAPGLVKGTIPARLNRVLGLVNTKHGSGDQSHINKLIFRMNDFIVPVSKESRDLLVKAKLVPENKVKVIYNGIDPEKFHPTKLKSAVRESLGIDNGTFIIGTTGRLDHYKDYKSLISAVGIVLSNNIPVKLVFVGDGLERASLEKFAQDKGLSNNIIFLGFKRDVANWVNSFDVFVLSSLTEGLSIALLEAMSLAKPVVATNVGGNPEVVVNGVTGYLVSSKTPNELADAMIKILQNPNQARTMGEAGRRRVDQKFSLDKMIREYGILYEKCLIQRHKSVFTPQHANQSITI